MKESPVRIRALASPHPFAKIGANCGLIVLIAVAKGRNPPCWRLPSSSGEPPADQAKADGMTLTQAMLFRRLGGRSYLPALLLRRRPAHPRVGVIAFAVALLVAVLGLRLTVTSSEPVLILSLVPVALLALEAGTRGGIAGATLGVASVGIWSTVENVELSVFGYLTRVSTLFLVGLLVGHLAHRLSEAREAQKLLLDFAPEGALGLDLDGRVTIANAAAEELFGYGPDELIGLQVEQLVPDFFGAMKRSLQRRMTWEDADLTARSKDGRARRIHATVDALASDAGVLLVRLWRDQASPAGTAPSHGLRI
jgi:PAS domain S-box-containing protein